MKKTKLLKTCQKKTSEMAQRTDKLENLVDRQEQYSRCNCLLVHGIAETNNENMDDLALKTINEKLDVDITENEIDWSHRIGRKKDGQRPRPVIVKLTRYNTRKKVFANKRKLKGTGVSVTESLMAKRMEQLNKAREEYSFTNVCTTDGKILFKLPNENKSNLFYDWKLMCCFCVMHEWKSLYCLCKNLYFIFYFGGIMRRFPLSKTFLDWDSPFN